MVNEYGAVNPMAYQQLFISMYEQFMTRNNVEVSTLIAKYNVSWVLLAMSAEIEKRIHPGEHLQASVRNTNRRGPIFRRDIEIQDSDGQVAVRAAKFLTVLDLDTRRISRNESILRSLEMDEDSETFPAQSRTVYDEKDFEFRHIRTVHPSWIDELGHTNNVRYGEMSYDAISEEKRMRFANLKRMELFFFHELKRDEQVEIWTRETENEALVLGISKVDAKHSFLSRYVFSPE